MNALYDPRLLKVVLVLAEELHFGRAANRLGIAQPRLSQMIKHAEAVVGARLFARTTRTTRLTEAGEALVEGARRGFEEFDKGVSEARLREAGFAGTLDVGYVAIATLMGLPLVVRHFRAAYPKVRLRLHEISSDAQLDLLATGKLDLAIVSTTIPRGQNRVLHQLRDRLMIVLPEHHPLCAKGSLRLKDIEDEPFLFFPSSAASHLHCTILSFFVAEGLPVTVSQELGSWHSIISFVSAGMGYTLAPACTRRFQVIAVKHLPLSEGVCDMTLELCAPGNSDSPLLAKFADLFGAHAFA